MRYHFGSYTFDLGTRELWSGGEPVVLEPRTFAVLAHLLRHRSRVVPKEELLDEIWGDRFVGESALTTQIKHARDAVGDDGRTQRAIRTVHRVGYRFVGDVIEEEPVPTAPEDASVWAMTSARRLVGRDADLRAVERRLADHRLVTIVGPGGVGKTSLAACLRDGPAPDAPDGVWLCELVNTRDPAAVGNVILATLGVGQQSDADPEESLLRALEDRRAVLVLDNCEHVFDAVGGLAGRLLRRCPGLRVLATSRMPLGVDGESVYPLAPLGVDDAVECFVAKAAAVGAEVDRNDPAAVELCRRLDGVPLALELAAARARLLSPGQMLDLLRDRFRLLRDTNHGADERHQSLHRTIAWSWDGLSDADQGLLARLTVFVGAVTLDDVAAVALPGDDPLDVVDALGRLVSRSLVVSLPAAAGQMTFRLLESVREFAADRLADPADVRRRHAAHFLALAESLDAGFQTADIEGALEAMGAAWDNLRAAVHYAAEAGDVGTVRRIVRAVGPYADVFQVYEVLDWCDHADLVGAPVDDGGGDGDEDPAIFADALAIKARMSAHRGEHSTGRALAELAHGWCETHTTLLSVVWCAYYAGDLDRVIRSADRLLELSRSDQGFDRGFAEGFAAIVAAVRQDPAITSTAVSPSDAERGLLGTQACLTEGLRLCTRDPERAAELLQAVVDSSIRHDYRLHLGAAASTLTQIALPGRPAPEAMRTLRWTLEMYLERSMWMLISADTVMAAKLLADDGDAETACRLLGAREASGYAVGLSEVLRTLLEDDLRARLGERFDELAAQGAGWRPPEAGRVAVDALGRASAEAR